MDLDLNILLRQGVFTLDADIHVKDPVVGLFGRSGAGKSTLLHLLSGLKKPENGRIVLKGRTLCDIENGVYVPPEKRDVGVVFQDSRLFPHLNVEQNILFGVRGAVDRDLFESVITTLEIGPLLKRGPVNLSGGEKQRVAIARALMRRPSLLLLDEPFSGIDVGMRSVLMTFLSRVRRRFDCPMMIISHTLPDLLSLTDTLVVIRDGRITGYGQSTDLAFDPACSDLIKHSGIYATFEATVEAVDPPNGFLILRANNSRQTLRAPYREGFAPGAAVKARLRPEDIVLAKGPADFITSQNQITAKVVRVQSAADEVLLELDAGFRILSGISRKAEKSFGIEPGKEIWIMFKTLAVEYFLSGG